jgi:hypothetical protein
MFVMVWLQGCAMEKWAVPKVLTAVADLIPMWCLVPPGYLFGDVACLQSVPDIQGSSFFRWSLLNLLTELFTW